MKSHLLCSNYHMLRLTTCKHSYFMLFYELWQLACCRQQLCVRVCSTVCITISEQHFEHLKIVYTFNSLCSLWWWPAGDTDRFCNDLRSVPWTLGGMVLFLSALSLIIVTTVGHESFNKFTLCCLVIWRTYYSPFMLQMKTLETGSPQALVAVCQTIQCQILMLTAMRCSVCSH